MHSEEAYVSKELNWTDIQNTCIKKKEQRLKVLKGDKHRAEESEFFLGFVMSWHCLQIWFYDVILLRKYNSNACHWELFAQS